MNYVGWLEQAEADVAPDDRWLSESEADQMAGMRFHKRRSEWRLGRWTAKRAVAACLGWSGTLAEIEIRAASSGAPQVCCPEHAVISLSHRAGRAICCVSTTAAALGCDLELIEPRSSGFIEDYFTHEERISIQSAPEPAQSYLATLFWSAKESALKTLQVGLRADTRSVSVRLADANQPGLWKPLQVSRSDGGVLRGWYSTEASWVRTLVADSAPYEPLSLDLLCTADSRHEPAGA
jgi:4'-phosphopantetheinyl transferase